MEEIKSDQLEGEGEITSQIGRILKSVTGCLGREAEVCPLTYVPGPLTRQTYVDTISALKVALGTSKWQGYKKEGKRMIKFITNQE